MTFRMVETRVVSCDAPEGSTELNIHRPYSMHSTGSLLPQRLDMRWESVNSNQWELVRLTVNGARIKKDGTIGLTTATTTFIDHARVWSNLIPDWVQAKVDEWSPQIVKHGVT